MTDVIDQLRQLGEAAETHVESVTPEEVLLAPAGPGGRGRWSPLRSLGAAAAAIVGLVVLGVGLTRVLDDQSPVVTSPVAPSEAASDSELAPRQDRVPAPVPVSASLTDRTGWQELRDCESSSDYGVNSGNGFSGAYQFEPGTWTVMMATLGMAGYDRAHLAPPAIQDAAAAELYGLQGAKPWPLCGPFLSGPMSSPVVYTWLDTPSARDQAIAGRPAQEVIVFMDPEVTDDQRERIEAEISNWGSLGPSNPATVFVDKEAAFAEFSALFEDRPELVENVTVDQLPPSLRVSLVGDDVPDLSIVRALDGVLRVIGPASDQLVTVSFGTTAVQVDLQSEVSQTALLDGVVPYDPWYFSPVEPLAPLGPITLAGHGEDPSDPFYGVADLSVGDIVVLNIDDVTLEYAVETHIEVSVGDPAKPTESETLTLTTQGSDRSLRRLITARLTS